ncbi:hypothetical protein Angca_000875, partial [Angiostrongylus cantonensis]
MKEAADICIQSYKKQLLQKDEALKEYKKFAEQTLSTSSRPIMEKEIIREEVRVADEQTEAELRQAFGEENLEELEKANRALYRKLRRSVVSVHNTVECQTDEQLEKGSRVDIEPNIGNSLSRSSPTESIKSFFFFKKNDFVTERTRYKNEIKQLQARLRRMAANNKELILTCEKIRDDTLATLETRAPEAKEINDEALLKIRTEFEKARKENRTLRKTIDEQKRLLENFKMTRNKTRNTEAEVAMWNERKKTEENLDSAKKRLAAAVEREKEALERLDKRQRVLEELKRDEEARKKQLDRALKKNAQLQQER